MQLTTLVEEFIARVRADKRYAPTTIKSYGSALRAFAAWSGDNPPLSAFAHADLDRYQLHLQQRICDTTVGGAICALRVFGAYLVDERRLLPENPAMRLKKPRRSPARRELVSDDELLATLAACERIADPFRAALAHAVISLFIHTPFRRSEALNLRISDYYPQSQAVVCRKAKGGNGYRAYLTPDAQAALDVWLTLRPANCRHDFLFAIDPNRRLGDVGLRILFLDVIAIAGFKGATNIRPHSMRHAYATRLARNGADVRDIQVAMNHKLTSTTLIYLHSSEERLRDLAPLSALRPSTPATEQAPPPPPAAQSPDFPVSPPETLPALPMTAPQVAAAPNAAQDASLIAELLRQLQAFNAQSQSPAAQPQQLAPAQPEKSRQKRTDLRRPQA